jgi:hypothetical protein
MPRHCRRRAYRRQYRRRLSRCAAQRRRRLPPPTTNKRSTPRAPTSGAGHPAARQQAAAGSRHPTPAANRSAHRARIPVVAASANRIRVRSSTCRDKGRRAWYHCNTFAKSCQACLSWLVWFVRVSSWRDLYESKCVPCRRRHLLLRSNTVTTLMTSGRDVARSATLSTP